MKENIRTHIFKWDENGFGFIDDITQEELDDFRESIKGSYEAMKQLYDLPRNFKCGVRFPDGRYTPPHF